MFNSSSIYLYIECQYYQINEWKYKYKIFIYSSITLPCHLYFVISTNVIYLCQHNLISFLIFLLPFFLLNNEYCSWQPVCRLDQTSVRIFYSDAKNKGFFCILKLNTSNAALQLKQKARPWGYSKIMCLRTVDYM